MDSNEDVPLVTEPTNSETLIIPKIRLLVDKSDNSADGTETPPLTPVSEDSVDDASTEEPTVEEVGASGSQVDSQKEATEDKMLLVGKAAGISQAYKGYDRNHLGLNIGLSFLVFMLISAAFGFIAYGIFTSYDDVFTKGREKTKVTLLLIPREKWNYKNTFGPRKWAPYEAKRVVVTHTETEACETLMDCLEMLNEQEQEVLFKYNFLVAPDGYVFEILGWQVPSPLFPDTPTMVIAFIGNYEERAPSVMQLAQFQSLLDQSEELKYLIKKYSIHGRNFKKEPKKLYSYISKLKNWDNNRYVMDNVPYLHPEIELFPYFEL